MREPYKFDGPQETGPSRKGFIAGVGDGQGKQRSLNMSIPVQNFPNPTLTCRPDRELVIHEKYAPVPRGTGSESSTYLKDGSGARSEHDFADFQHALKAPNT